MAKTRFFRFLGEIAIIVGAVTVISFPVAASSCKISPEGITIIGGDYSSPKLTDFIVSGTDSLMLTFSDEITLGNLYISPSSVCEDEFARYKIDMESVVVEENGADDGIGYMLHLPGQTECGREYVLFAEAEDKKGNTLSFSTVFYGYNEKVPKLVLSEVRTEASKPKPEFVEFYCISDGNTGGIVLEVFYNKADSFRYVFPAASVKAGEYIVLHLRSYDEQEPYCVNEVDSGSTSLSASSAADSCPDARDLWHDDNSKLLGKTAVILLWERSRGRMMDALLIAESEKDGWPTYAAGDAAQSAVLADVWIDGAAVTDAVCTDKSTATRTVSRQNIAEITEAAGSDDFVWPVPVSASDWMVVATSQATPGKQNSSKPVQ